MDANREEVIRRFPQDVATHEMQVIRDDGVNRHIRFKRPGTSCYYFDLITWPGHLCYTGDMGTFVFQRLHDMFEFFRTDRKYGPNFGYWAEKLIAIDKGGVVEFDEVRFTQKVNEYRVGWMRRMKEEGHNKEERRDLWEKVEDEVLGRAQDGEHAANSAVWEFRDGEFEFTDFFDGGSCMRYNFHFIWCCHAIAWGIKQYDDR